MRKIGNLEKGKLPPQATDLEETILGVALIDLKGTDILLDMIQDPEAFYLEKHGMIFQAIKELSDHSDPVDLKTVSQKLKTKSQLDLVGGYTKLISLTNGIASSAHQEYHCKIVLQQYMLRKMIQLGNRCIEQAYDPKVDVFELMDAVHQDLDGVANVANKGSQLVSWSEAVERVPKRVEFLTNNKGELTGVDTGLDNLNKFFSGWQPTDLIIIGADSGTGKTALAMCHILAAARQGKAVGMASMEMSTVQLAIRGVAVSSNLHMKQLTQTGFEKDKYWRSLSDTVDGIKGLPIYIDDRPSLTVPEMKRKAREMKRKHDIQLFIVDFIQMFSGEEDDVKLAGLAARELKNLAKELDIPVIALSQLNREVKKAKWNMPSKHHLKNSSGVEEAADIIGLLYRPGYYNYQPHTHAMVYEELGLRGNENAALIVAKNRQGGLGSIPLCYVENKTKYVNADDFITVDEHNQVVEGATVFD